MRSVFLMLLVACRPFDSVLCLPCVEGCGAGLECVQGVCVSPVERCGIVETPPPCGGPCGDGLECFEDQCRGPVEIASGAAHSCVRWPSGRVSCWGFNDYGQAGPGDVHILEPQVLPNLDNAVALSLGGNFSCALRADGTAACWGYNERGALGNFSYEIGRDELRSEPLPQPVKIDVPLVQIDADRWNACALDADGGIWCWGSGSSPCLLGDGLQQDTQLPLRIPSDIPFDRIEIGDSHGLALAGDAVYGWGSDRLHQIQNGGTNACRPALIEGVTATDISSGQTQSCVVTGGEVRCFGTDYAGSLPDHELSFDEPVIDVETQAANGCARTASGRIHCWGDNVHAQLGHLGVDQEGRNGPASLLANSEGALDFSMGTIFGCMLRDDGVFCWGSGPEGQLGKSRFAVRQAERFSTESFTKVSVGSDHSCGISGDRLLCWGSNRYGQIGIGMPSYVEPPTVVEGIDPIDVVSGNHYSCAIDRSRRVYCWGRYDRPVFDFPQPQIMTVPTEIIGAAGAEQISASDQAACAVFDNGAEVRCWGYAVIGMVTTIWENRMYLEPYTLPGVSDVEELNLGLATGCVLHRDRHVTCWGALDLAIDVPNAVRVRAGQDYVCFHLDDGTVSCMGNNSRGVLGNGTLRSPGALGPVHELGPVLEMSTDFFHSCALKPGDEVWCWGQDYYDGRLGQGPSHDHPVPIRVPNLDAVNLRALAVGRDSTCVIADDGLWCWGRDLGQLSGRAPVAATPLRIENLH